MKAQRINTSESVSLEEFISVYEEMDLDTTEPEELFRACEILTKLSNNSTFIKDLLIKGVEDSFDEQSDLSGYTAQSLILNKISSKKNYFLRANFWPSLEHSLTRVSGPQTFYYNYPHDHNFNFLTVGYFGPGYDSIIYNYDYNSVDGFSGEDCDLKYKGIVSLNKGDTLLYEAHKDVHSQLPPTSLSISLNIMQYIFGTNQKHQYAFNIEKSQISEVLNTRRDVGIPTLALLASLNRTRCESLFVEVAKVHPSIFMRVGAIQALISSAEDMNLIEDVLQLGMDSNSRVLREWTKEYAAKIAL
ncbi:MAG: hypothetical protein AAF296_06935 [Pseudomonadota bacterium]